MVVFAAEVTKAMSASVKTLAFKKEQEIHPVGVFEFDALRESWMYALIEEWVERSNLNDEDLMGIKLALFEVAIGA